MPRHPRPLLMLATVVLAAACAGAAPSPSPSPAPSPSPSPSQRPAPTASLTPGARMLDLFMTNFVEAQPPFHGQAVAWQAKMASGEWAYRDDMDFDARGPDMRASVKSARPSGVGPVRDLVQLHGVSYSRGDSGRWFVVTDFGRIQPVDPFAKLDPSDLRYVGEITRRGRTVQRLSTDRWIGGEIRTHEMQDARIASTTFILDLDSQGLPVSAELDFVATGKVDPYPITREYRTTYEFTDIGKPVEILDPLAPAASSAPSSAPDPAIGARIVRAFTTGFVDAKPPFHAWSEVLIEATFHGQPTTARIQMEVDAAGKDYQGTLSTSGVDGTSEVEIIVLGGIAYARGTGEEWRAAPDFTQTQPVNPFSELDPADLEYVGTVIHEGRTLHHLRTTKWIGADPKTMRKAGTKVVSSTFSIFVDSTGMPFDARLDALLAPATAGAAPAEVRVTASYAFSAIGEPVRIDTPPLPDPAVGARILRAFRTDFAAAKSPFHSRAVLLFEETAGTGSSSHQDVEVDASGDDMMGTISLASTVGPAIVVDVIVLDGKEYYRADGVNWHIARAPGFGMVTPLDVFAALDASSLEYAGAVTRNGRTLHRLRTTRWVGGDITKGEIANAKLTATTFYVEVDEKGMPVRAILDFTVTGTAADRRTVNHFTATYEFSAVGKPVTIVKPKVG